MKVAIWSRVDRNKDNPVIVYFYDGQIYFTEKNVYIEKEGSRDVIPLKDVCMIDFDYEEYKKL